MDAEECLTSDYARLGAKRDWGFWLVWVSNLMCDILSVLDRVRACLVFFPKTHVFCNRPQ